MWSLRHIEQGRILRGRAEKQAMQASLENIMNVCEIEKKNLHIDHIRGYDFNVGLHFYKS